MDLSEHDELIDRVQRGALTPEDAEKEAERIGIAPLATKPEPADFNPLTEAWWSLPMAVAWIAWRSTDIVRDQWDAYRAECWHWEPRRWQAGPVGSIHNGHALVQLGSATPLSLSTRALLESATGSRATEVDDAKTTLWRAFGEGLLNATGMKKLDGLRIAIPAREWSQLEWDEQKKHDPVQLRGKFSPARKGYDTVRLPAADLFKLWPGKGPSLDSLPETISPLGPGHMALYSAAQWIATEGGRNLFEPGDTAIWRKAYGELFSQMSNEVSVSGVEAGRRTTIDPNLFVAMEVDYPFGQAPRELRFTDELYLRSYPYVEHASWAAGFDDSLCDRSGAKVTKLMVKKTDVARLWPFETTTTAETNPPYKTGLRGRPTSWSLIEAEFLRRRGTGVALRNLRAEADALAAWVKEAHPAAPQPTVKTIKEKLRSTHSRAFDLTGK